MDEIMTQKDDRFRIFSNKMYFMNAFLVCMMVMTHMYNWGGHEDQGTDILYYALGGAMAFFFFMSGFWYFRNFSVENSGIKFLKRIRNLLLPYFMWNTFKVVLKYGVVIIKTGEIGAEWNNVIKDYIFLGSGVKEVITPDNWPLWYVIRILTYFAVSPFIYYLIKNKWVGMAAVVAVAVTFRNGGYHAFEGWLAIFMLGGYIAINYEEQFERLFTASRLCQTKRRIGVLGVLSIHILGCCVWALMLQQKDLDHIVVYLYYLVYELLAIALFNVVEVSEDTGGFAFALYMGHIVFAAIINKFLNLLDGRTPFWSGTIHVIVLYVLVLAAAFYTCKITKKYFPVLYGVICGGR